MKKLRLLLALVALLPVIAAAVPISVIVSFGNPPPPPPLPPPAPRFAFWSWTASVYGNTTSSGVPRLGRADLVNLSWYSGIGTTVASAYGSNMNGLATHIQNQGNGAGNAIVVQYYLPSSGGWSQVPGGPTCNPPPFSDFATHIATYNWNVYALGTSGTLVDNEAVAGCTESNSTTNVPSDSNGQKLEDYVTQYMYKYSVLGTQGGTNQNSDKMPTLQGLYHDNSLLGVPVTGDWLRTGFGAQSFGGSADTSYRAGLTLGYTWLKNNAPSLLRLGNITTWGCSVCSQGSSTLGGMDGLLNGGQIELLLGQQFGVEQFGTFAQAKSVYQFDMAHTAPNAASHLQIVMPSCAWDSNGRDYLTNHTAPWSADPNFQAARYQIAFVLQDDGWANINGTLYNSTTITWIDEMTVNPSTFVATGEASSTTGKGYMGQAIDPAWTQLANGVYARRYQNSLGGIWVAMVNPKSNGSQTVTPSNFPGGFGHFQLISGTQAPTINSGALVTSIALTDRDGRIAKLAP